MKDIAKPVKHWCQTESFDIWDYDILAKSSSFLHILHSQSILQIYKWLAQPNEDHRTRSPIVTPPSLPSFPASSPTGLLMGIKQKKAEFSLNKSCNLQQNTKNPSQIMTFYRLTTLKIKQKLVLVLEILTLSAAPIMLWSFQRVHRNSWSFARERKTFCNFEVHAHHKNQLISRPVFFPETLRASLQNLYWSNNVYVLLRVHSGRQDWNRSPKWFALWRPGPQGPLLRVRGCLGWTSSRCLPCIAG